MPSHPLITFASDFGTREYYVGAVKGAILSVNPEVRIVDTSHEIPSHDLLTAAFVLAGYYDTFPLRTIHLAVVDPEVGSNRRAIVVQTGRHIFLAPDNGLLSLIFEREEVSRVIAVEADHHYRKPVSPTFHGRDIFAPVAGWISKGLDISAFGPEITDYKKLTLPGAKPVGEGVLEGFVLHIDKFGNIVTSFSETSIAQLGGLQEGSSFNLNDREITRQVGCYAEGGDGELLFLLGSSGYYEIASNKKAASRILDARRGMKVALRLIADR